MNHNPMSLLVHENIPSKAVVTAFHVVSSVDVDCAPPGFATYTKNEALDVLESADKTIANLIVCAVARARGYIPCGTNMGIPTLMYMAHECETIEMKSATVMPMEYVAAIHAYTACIRMSAHANVVARAGTRVRTIADAGCLIAKSLSGATAAYKKCVGRGCIESCWRLAISGTTVIYNPEFIPVVRVAFYHTRDWYIPFYGSITTILYDLAKYVYHSGLDYPLVCDMLERTIECGFTDIDAVGVCAYRAFRMSSIPKLGEIAFRCLSHVGSSEPLAICHYAGIGTSVCIPEARRILHECKCPPGDHLLSECVTDWFSDGTYDVEGAGCEVKDEEQREGGAPPGWMEWWRESE